MEYTLAVLCFVYYVNSGDSFEITAPTPALKMPSRLMSTDHFNPLKLNVPLEPNVITTGHGGILNPTPIQKQLLTTGISQAEVSDIPVKKKLTTTFINDAIINPTPVLNLLTRLETRAENPITTNLPLNPKITTTGVVKNDAIEPTPVIYQVGTTAVAIPLAYDIQPEPRPSTEIVDRYFIESSQVSMNIGASVTTASQSEQEPNQVPTKSINDEVVQNMAPCKCKYSEETKTPALGFISYDAGNALTSQSLTPEGSKSDLESTSPNDVRQVIINLQLHLYVNSIPVLAAYALPLYF